MSLLCLVASMICALMAIESTGQHDGTARVRDALAWVGLSVAMIVLAWLEYLREG